MCQSCTELSWVELFFYNDLYLPIYTLTLKVCIILRHIHPDSIGSQNPFLLELQLKID
jgi:hypothetical protein